MNKALILTLMIMSGTSMIACNEGSDGGQTAQAATPPPPPPAPIQNPTTNMTPEAPLLTGAQLEEQVRNQANSVASDLNALTVTTGLEDVPLLEGGDAGFMDTNANSGLRPVSASPLRSVTGFVPAAAGR